MRTIRDGVEPRTATSTFTQLLSSESLMPAVFALIQPPRLVGRKNVLSVNLFDKTCFDEAASFNCGNEMGRIVSSAVQ